MGPFIPKEGPLEEGVMDQMCASWNQLALWLRQIDGLRRAV